MKVGYSLGPLLSVEEVLKCAALADSSGADSVWVPESWGRESFATLGAVSQVTKRVRLGTSIISIFARTPATVAMGATTLDMLSSSRSIIGLGTSTEAIVEGWHGTQFSKPVERMHEYVQCLRLMMSGEKTSYDGKYYRVNNFKILHVPPRIRIPIFMAAVNRRMVSLATELADGVILYMRPLEELARTVARIKQYAKGKNFEVALSLICAVSDSDPAEARRRAAKTLAFYVAVGKYYSKFLAENGFADEVKQITEEYRASGGDAAAKRIPDAMLDSIAVAGSRKECSSQLGRFISAGVTLPIIQVNPVNDAESSFREMLSTF